MTKVSNSLELWGEQVAVAYLREAGMQILATRWRTRDGEIDCVARDGRTLVVVEVKARSGTGFGAPVEAVTPAKQRRLRRLATAWLIEHGQQHGGGFPDVRFDVVGVLRGPHGVAVDHIPAAF